MKQFRAAVVGCGWIGAQSERYSKAVTPGTHADAYCLNKKFKLAALVDSNRRNLNKAGKKFTGAALYTDMEKMFKEINPDIVSVATPTGWHGCHVMLAAKHKCKVILCEKPIAGSVAEAQKMIKACTKGGSRLFINHMRRFDPMLNEWSKKVRDGLIGKVVQANVCYYNGIYNNGSHWIDLLNMFLGKPKWVAGYFSQIRTRKKGDVSIDGVIRYKNGALVTIQALPDNYGHLEFKLMGDKGFLSLNNLGFEVEFQKKVENKDFSGVYMLSSQKITKGKTRSFMKGTIDYMASYLEGKVGAIGTGQDGLENLKILNALEMSARQDSKRVYPRFFLK